MTTLTEWLEAQIAEDERIARRALDFRYDHPTDAPWERARLVAAKIGRHAPASTLLEARWDPARVLAECNAKRRIIAEHTDPKFPYDPSCPVCLDEVESGDDGEGVSFYVHMKRAPCPTLRALAVPYEGRPGYDRKAWAL